MPKTSKIRSSYGFTLVELIATLVFIGILAAITAPSFLGLLHRIKVDNAKAELVGAIKETQRLAMRNGKKCRIDLNLSNNIISSPDTNCLLNKRRIDNDVFIRSNFPGASTYITFSHKGNTTRIGTLTLSAEYTKIQKCLVISLGIGIMRTGNYTGSKTGSVSAKNCQ